MTTVARHVVIRGLVQGVGYRAWVADEASRRALEGWVRNRRDGSVEAVFTGASDTVAAVIALCKQGPALARVDAVDARDADDCDLEMRQEAERFSVLPTL